MEKILGHRFRNQQLLAQALTHRSVSEFSDENQERLEFLGDAVLSHVVSDYLYRENDFDSEGQLTLKRSALVNKGFLATVGERLQLGDYLHVNSGVRLHDNRVRRNLIGDAMEALIGAVYLDGGIQPTRRFIQKCIITDIHKLDLRTNHKGRLIELCHQNNLGTPHFKLVRTSGPEHDKSFEVEIRIGKRTFPIAKAENKKAAEQGAARLALNNLRPEL